MADGGRPKRKEGAQPPSVLYVPRRDGVLDGPGSPILVLVQTDLAEGYGSETEVRVDGRGIGQRKVALGGVRKAGLFMEDMIVHPLVDAAVPRGELPAVDDSVSPEKVAVRVLRIRAKSG